MTATSTRSTSSGPAELAAPVEPTTRAGTGSAGRTRRPTWSGCGAGSRSSTPSPPRGGAPVGAAARRGADQRTRRAHRRQAVQMVRAGLKAIYLCGWQVAADANLSGQTYPDQSLYPATPCRRSSAGSTTHCCAPTRSSAAEGRSSATGSRRSSPTPRPDSADRCNAFELMKAMIEAGAAGVHFEDQLAAEKKCGHLGGKVLVPTAQFVRTLIAARLAADVLDVPTVLVARTDALRADAADERHRRARPAVPDRRAHRRRLLPGARRDGGGDRARARLRAVRRPAVVSRPRRPISARRSEFAEAIHDELPGQAAGLQLLAVVQLEAAPRRAHDREVPARARRDWAMGSSSSRWPAGTR